MPIVRSVTLPDGEKLYWIDLSPAERLAEERKAAERRAVMMADGHQRMFEALERRRRRWQFWKA
jgi:hypothetical protein